MPTGVSFRLIFIIYIHLPHGINHESSTGSGFWRMPRYTPSGTFFNYWWPTPVSCLCIYVLHIGMIHTSTYTHAYILSHRPRLPRPSTTGKQCTLYLSMQRSVYQRQRLRNQVLFKLKVYTIVSITISPKNSGR